jgi:phosphate acetyltransferase
MNDDSTILKRLSQQAQVQPRRIIFPEQDDPRVQQAAATLAKESWAIPVFLRAEKTLSPHIEYFENLPNAEEWRNKAVDFYVQKKHKKQMTPAQAKVELENPLLLAAVLLSLGYIDLGIAGSVATSAEVIKASLRGIGLAPNAILLSSAFLMALPNRCLSYADCAVNPSPDSAQLAQIAIDTAASHLALTGETPKVAMLSFSTKGSAEHEDVSKVREAVAIVRKRKPDLLVDGELQFDAAFVPDVAASKAKESDVAGKANVFVFPDLNSGNIAYKITQRLGGAHAIGPYLQGLAKTWLDLSRGCSSEDIVNAALIGSALTLAYSKP